MTLLIFIPFICSLHNPNPFFYENQSLKFSSPKSNTRESILYCMCHQDSLDWCKSSKACDLYSVPADHYFSHRDAQFWKSISELQNKKVVIYVASAQNSNYFSINPFNFVDDSNTLRFTTADNDYRNPVILKGSNMGNSEVQFDCTIQSLTSVDFDQSFVNHVSSFTIRNAPLAIQNEISVSVLNSDLSSLLSFTGTLYITGNLYMMGSTPSILTGSIILKDSSNLTIDNSAAFPVISLENDETGKSAAMLFLSDLYEDRTLKIGISEFTGSKTIQFDEKSMPSFIIYNRYSSTTTTNEDGTDAGGDDAAQNSLNFLFNIGANGMSVHFSKVETSTTVPAFPENFHIHFEHDLAAEDASLLELTLDPIAEGSYPIDPITTPINLRLMTLSTVSEFFKIRNEYQLASLTVNFENYLTAIKFAADAIDFDFNNGETDADESTQATGSVQVNTTISDLFNVITSSKEITFSQETGGSIHNIVLIANNSINVVFQDGFPTGEEANNITLLHYTNPITIQSSFPTPNVTLIDNIINVSYNTPGKEDPIVIDSQEYVNSNNLNAGPVATYQFTGSNIRFPQNACLAQEVRFTGNDFIFEYIKESVTKYTFENSVTIANIASEGNVDSAKLIKESTPVTFNAQSVTFEGDNKFNNDGNSPISSEIGNLTCSVNSIPSVSFSQPIKIDNSLYIENSTFETIYFGPDTVRMDSSATLQQVIGDMTPEFQILTSSTEKITLYYEETNSKSKELDSSTKSLIKNTLLYLNGDTANIFIDKSWYTVDIDESFKIVLKSETSGARIETDLMNLPPFTFYYLNANNELVQRKDIVSTKAGDDKFVGSPAFIVIIVLACIIVIVIIVGIVICVKHKKNEKYSARTGETFDTIEVE